VGWWKIVNGWVVNRQWLGGKSSMVGWLDGRVDDWMARWYHGRVALLPSSHDAI